MGIFWPRIWISEEKEMTKHLNPAFLLLALCITLNAGSAKASGLATQFDWQAAWGTILPDTKIPSVNFNVKNDISRAVELCGTQSNYSLIPAYIVDVNGDGLADYLDGAYPFFASGVAAGCPIALCTADQGCNISIYLHESVTQVLTASEGDTTCPAAPKDNTSCLSNCPATTDQCPALFKYNAPLVWDAPVISWSFIPVCTYNTMRSSSLTAEGKTKYRLPFAGNNVLRTVRSSSLCTLEEQDTNNDGVIAASESCVKYYQFAYGRFIDMYAPMASDLPATPENDNRYTMVEYSRDAAMIDSDDQKNWRSADNNTGINDVKLVGDGGFFSFQIKDYTGKGDLKNDKSGKENVDLMCHEYANTSSNTYFVPTRTDLEVESFDKAAQSGRLEGVTVKDCRRRFTSWVGQTTCPAVACGQTITIAAERRCQRSSSAYGACSECDGAADPAPIYNSPDNKCFFSQVCAGPPCGNGGDCLPATAMILMADGSQKEMDKMRPGEKILGFKKDEPLGTLHPTTITEVHATDRSPLIQINDMKISQNHQIMNDNGHAISASLIRKGDHLIGLSGQPILVESVAPVEDDHAVYNFVLDGADGFIVDGLRVLAHRKQNE